MVLRIYKPGQGRYARISAGVFLALATLYGCQALTNTLADSGALPEFMKPVFFGRVMTYAAVVPVAVFLVVMAVVIWFLNYPKMADFLIDTEIEMGRVAWPGRKTVIASSTVVVVTVVLMSFLLFGIDQVIIQLFKLLKIY
jgi:preprotein translocase SecE subunit